MFAGSLLTVLLATASLPADDADTSPTTHTALQYPNRTVIPGTCTWGIGTNRIADQKQRDLWWSTQVVKERWLHGMNGAMMARVRLPFDRITVADLEALDFKQGSINGSDGDNQLSPGTVLAVRTGTGNYAKLKVVRYYRKHDFCFPGARAHISDTWRQLLAEQPDQANFNIEIEWVFYKVK